MRLRRGLGEEQEKQLTGGRNIICEHTIEKKNVLITGVSGYIGQKIVERFSNREDIGEIIGIDIFAPLLPGQDDLHQARCAR